METTIAETTVNNMQDMETLIAEIQNIKDVSISIYSFLAFAIIVMACGFVIYLIGKPLFIILKGG